MIKSTSFTPTTTTTNKIHLRKRGLKSPQLSIPSSLKRRKSRYLDRNQSENQPPLRREPSNSCKSILFKPTIKEPSFSQDHQEDLNHSEYYSSVLKTHSNSTNIGFQWES